MDNRISRWTVQGQLQNGKDLSVCSGASTMELVSALWVKGAHGSVVIKALCYKPEGRRFDTRWGEFLNLPNPSGRTRHSASNRNEYQKHKNNDISGE
jgi:hypothetical protein